MAFGRTSPRPGKAGWHHICATSAPGRSRQDEVEGLAVLGGPFSDEVGDQLAVLLGCEHQGSVGRSTDVVAVHPRVPGIDPIHQVAHGSAPKGGQYGTRTAARGREPSAGSEPAGGGRDEFGDEPIRTGVRPFPRLSSGDGFGATAPTRNQSNAVTREGPQQCQEQWRHTCNRASPRCSNIDKDVPQRDPATGPVRIRQDRVGRWSASLARQCPAEGSGGAV